MSNEKKDGNGLWYCETCKWEGIEPHVYHKPSEVCVDCAVGDDVHISSDELDQCDIDDLVTQCPMCHDGVCLAILSLEWCKVNE